MDITQIFNIIEGIFWIVVALFFLAPTFKPDEKHRWFCLFGALVFFTFGLSDFYEVHTGAWWKPRQLLLWKAACIAGIAGTIIWYVKINGSWKNTIDKLKRPASKKKLKDGHTETNK